MAKGTIRPKCDGVWQLIAERQRGEDGKRRQATRIFRGTKRQAEKALHHFVIEAAGLPTGESGTTGELLDNWLAVADLAPSGRQTATEYVRNYLKPALGHVPVDRLTTMVVDRALRELSLHGSSTGGPLAPATVNRAHGILSRACAQGVRWHQLATNPARDATKPAAPAPKHRAPTSESVRSVLARARATDPTLYTFLALTAATGARRGEVCALRWDDLDGSELRIRRSVSVVQKKVYVKATKTGRERVVPLGPATVELLDEHREGLKAAGLLRAKGYIFSTSVDGSEPWKPDYATKSLIKLRRTVGADFRLHDLRHYAGSQMIGAGVPVTTAARRLGHARPSTTTDLYGTPLDANDMAAAVALEDTLSVRTND